MTLFPEFCKRYGPWAVVAGASEGIGQAYVDQLATKGLNILMLARRREVLDAQAELMRRRHRVEIETAAIDLASPKLADEFAAACGDRDIGLLVYNACYSKIARFADVPHDDHMRCIDVNCRGPLTLLQQLGPKLLARKRGGVILMSSMSGFQGSAMVSTYAATKAFTTNLAESLWAEWQAQGVDVLACVAGATSTPGFESSTPEDKRAKAFPMRPEQVALEGIANLSKGPVHITGRLNRAVHAGTGLLGRSGRTRFFSKATQDMYAQQDTPQ